jgi:hypothetical protein
MVIEHFKHQDAVPVYQRFDEKGRMTPEGLEYVSSWVDMKLERCFQVMETSDPKLMFEWIANWNDLVDFEIVPIMSSEDAVQTVRAKL